MQRQGARAENLMREHVFRNRELVRRSRALQTDKAEPPLPDNLRRLPHSRK
jgi:hypothetical protein